MNFELVLPKTISIHLVFYISLLKLVPPDVSLALRVEVEPNSNREYKVEKILDC